MKGNRYLLVLCLVLSACVPGVTGSSGSTLREVIENLQRSMVRESWAEDAASCFTDADLARFIRSKTLERILAKLRNDKAFLSAVEKICEMPLAEQSVYLRECRRPLRPLWQDIGEISPRGTTSAGQKCESLIAAGAVRLAEEILRAARLRPDGDRL